MVDLPTISHSKSVCPIISIIYSKPIGPINHCKPVRPPISQGKSVCPVNHSKPVLILSVIVNQYVLLIIVNLFVLLIILNPFVLFIVNLYIHPISHSKSACPKLVRLVNHCKPVHPISHSKPVRPVNHSKLVHPV